MSTVLKFRRGNTAAANAFIGQEGELFVDTTKDTLVVHDGVTAGGVPLATESYVTTQISNLIDSAPTALNTLNELAAALNDDANFASTVTTSLAGKQATLVSGTNIKSIVGVSLLGSGNIDIKWSDISNKPTLFSGSYNDLTDKPTLFDGAYASLTGAPTLATVATSGSYNDLTDKPTLFDGAYSSLTGSPTFKTINGNSILGSGDITISGGSGGIALTDLSAFTVVTFGEPSAELTYNNSTGTFTLDPVDLSYKQNTLVSGTNIKTINGQSLLGAGNITISGGSGGSSLTYGQFVDNTVALTTTAADQVIDTFSAVDYRSSKYIIQAVCDQVGIHSTEVLIIHNGATVYITEYATLFTGTSLFTVDASIVGSPEEVQVTVTPTNANTTFDVVRTSLAARTFTPPSLEGDLMLLSGTEDLQTETGSVDLNA